MAEEGTGPPGPCGVMVAVGPSPGAAGQAAAPAHTLAQGDRLGDTRCLVAGLGTVPCQGGEQRPAAHHGCMWWWGRGVGCSFSPGTVPVLDRTFFWGGGGTQGGDKPPALGFLGWERGPLRQRSFFSPQFRENLKDVLPSLPSQDDYFLLKWLRGNPRVGGHARGRLEDPTGWPQSRGRW